MRKKSGRSYKCFKNARTIAPVEFRDRARASARGLFEQVEAHTWPCESIAERSGDVGEGFPAGALSSSSRLDFKHAPGHPWPEQHRLQLDVNMMVDIFC